PRPRPGCDRPAVEELPDPQDRPRRRLRLRADRVGGHPDREGPVPDAGHVRLAAAGELGVGGVTVAPLLLLALAAPPAEWTFRDEAEHGGQSVLTFRTVE